MAILRRCAAADNFCVRRDSVNAARFIFPASPSPYHFWRAIGNLRLSKHHRKQHGQLAALRARGVANRRAQTVAYTPPEIAVSLDSLGFLPAHDLLQPFSGLHSHLGPDEYIHRRNLSDATGERYAPDTVRGRHMVMHERCHEAAAQDPCGRARGDRGGVPKAAALKTLSRGPCAPGSPFADTPRGRGVTERRERGPAFSRRE